MVLPIDEDDIRRMVSLFYGQVREDPLLGPVFERRLAARWPAHLEKMEAFWSSALLGSRRYAGNPRSAHAAIEELEQRHFDRWLELFHDTLFDVFEPAIASQIHGRATAMARGLSFAVANRKPGLPLTEARGRDA